jgi:hypothetical protein
MEKLDDFMRDKLNSDNPAGRFEFREEYWEQAMLLLEADEAGRKKRRGFWWWWPIIGIVVVAGAVVWEVRRPTSNVEHQTSNAERPTSNVERQTSNAERPTSNVERQTSDVERQTSNAERQTSNVERPTSNVERPTSDVERQTSKAGRPTSNVERPTSNVERPTSDVERPTSDVERQTSNAERPTSNAERPTSNVERRTSAAERPTSNVERPTSNVERPTSNVERPTSNVERRTSAAERQTFDVRRLTTLLTPVVFDSAQQLKFKGPVFPVDEIKKSTTRSAFVLQLEAGGAFYPGMQHNQWGGQISLAGYWKLRPSWAASVGVSMKRTPDNRVTATDSTASNLQSFRRYDFGYRNDRYYHESKYLYAMEFPVRLYWLHGPWGVQAGITPGFLIARGGNFVHQVNESLAPDGIVDRKKELRSIDPSVYRKFDASASLGVFRQLNDRFSIFGLAGYQFKGPYLNQLPDVIPAPKGIHWRFEAGLRFSF